MATAPHTNLLDQAFLTRQRAALDAERRAEARMADALGAETNNLVRGRQAAGVTAEGFGKGETASIDLQQARAEHRMALARLQAIDAALGRLDTGRYGICTDCGGPISRARLEAMPAAARCIRCEASRRAR